VNRAPDNGPQVDMLLGGLHVPVKHTGRQRHKQRDMQIAEGERERYGALAQRICRE